MKRRKLPRVKKVRINTAVVIALIGLTGTIITAYLGYLSISKPTELAISATQTANDFNRQYISPNSPITFLPIRDKELLVKAFTLEGSGERVNLRFIANNFHLDFRFSAPLEMECHVFVNNITEQFALDKYIEVDMSKFPTGSSYYSHWQQWWLPIINGVTINSCSTQTLRDLAVTDGDLIGLKIEWRLPAEISGPPIIFIPTILGETPVPTTTPAPTLTAAPMISPPEIFP